MSQETLAARKIKPIYSAENGYTVAAYKAVEGGNFTFHAVGYNLPDTTAAVLLTGEFQDSKFGRQFIVSGFELKPPDTKKEFVTFVSSLGIGLGKSKASRLFELCGPQIWKMIENNNLPAQASKIAKPDLIDKLQSKMAEANTERAILKLLDGMVSVDLAELRKANISADSIRMNPYLLCIHGATFNTVDEFAKVKGLADLDGTNRIEAALHEALKNAAGKGSSCLTGDILLNGDRKRCIEGALSMLNGKAFTVSPERAHKVLMEVVEAGHIVLNSGFFYSKESYFEEAFVAKKVIRLVHSRKVNNEKMEAFQKELASYEKEEKIELSDEQKAAVLGLAEHGIMIVTGYPGAGKTTTIKAMLHVLSKVEEIDRKKMWLMSPTGKAARRMEEATGYVANTVLSALGYTGVNTEEILRSDDPLDAEIIIVDELSMMDLQQMAMLLRHVKDSTRVVLIGDPDQLPSVGAGNVLLDLIQSGEIPVYLLSKIYRQKSAQYSNPIPENAAKIRKGRTDIDWVKNAESAFMQAPRTEDAAIFDTAVNLYSSIVRKSKLTVDDVSLLVPYRKKSGATSLTSTDFNRVLQEKINPVRATDAVLTAHGVSFHKGDKVMQLKNTEGPKNGDTGYVEAIAYASSGADGKSEKIARINFNGVVYDYTSKDMQHVDLAYASSVHKMQGAEVDTVILVVSNVHGALLARNLIYTAITRATKHVIVVGELDAFNRAILRDNTADPDRRRITLLASRIHHEGTKNKATQEAPFV